MKKISLGTIAFFIGISFSGCTVIQDGIASYKASEQKRAQCKMQYKSCIIKNSQGRDMTNPYTAQGVVSYCKRATCY